MANRIEDADVWLVRELYFALAAFADAPQYTISRIGGGRISIPEDQANDLDYFMRCVLEKYPWSEELSLMRVVSEIDVILTRRSVDGDAFDESFWTNEGFSGHPDWLQIRELARAFLIR